MRTGESTSEYSKVKFDKAFSSIIIGWMVLMVTLDKVFKWDDVDANTWAGYIIGILTANIAGSAVYGHQRSSLKKKYES